MESLIKDFKQKIKLIRKFTNFKQNFTFWFNKIMETLK